jgi:hypothetical protein
MRGQRTVGKGGIIGQLSVQRCARQTKDENEPSKEMVAGQFAGPSIEHRTSLIFHIKPILAILRTGLLQQDQPQATANVYTFNGTPDLDLSQSDTPHLTTLDP